MIAEVDQVIRTVPLKPDRHVLSPEGLANFLPTGSKGNRAMSIGFPDDILWPIFDRRNCQRKRERIENVPVQRHLILERVVRPLLIVRSPPRV